jgi:hypothetical protein
VDVPGSVHTQATAINDRTEIAGTHRLPNDPVLHAYFRDADGNFFTSTCRARRLHCLAA